MVTANYIDFARSFSDRSLAAAGQLNTMIRQNTQELDNVQVGQLSQLRDQYLAAAGYGGMTGFQGALPEAAMPVPSQAYQTAVRDHRDDGYAAQPIVRDHRSGDTATVVRDHRSGETGTVVRDHRSDPWATDVRDHRSDPWATNVRDHRSDPWAGEVRDHRSIDPGFTPPGRVDGMPVIGDPGFSVQHLDLAPGTGDSWISRLFNPERREACQFEHALRQNPQLLAAFQAAVGGQVLFDGRDDGKLTIVRNPEMPYGYGMPGLPNLPGMLPVQAMMAQMSQSSLAALQGANYGGGYGMGGGYPGITNPFQMMLLGGLGGIAGGLLGAGLGGGGLDAGLGGGLLGAGLGGGLLGMGLGGGLLGMGLGMGGFGGLQAPLGGLGAGSWNPLAAPGRINNTNPAYEAQSQAQIDSVLRNPSLTVEDKVTLMLMLIMNKMDKDIERQEQYINSIQQQQSNQGGAGGVGGGAGGMLGTIGGLAGMAFGGPLGAMAGGALGNAFGGAVGGAPGGNANGNGNAPSIDIETTKLKRMIDKRSQMFDMLRQIIDKYNETAKNMIQSIGR